MPNHAGIPKWLTYSTSKREALIVDVPAAMENDSEARERALLGHPAVVRLPYSKAYEECHRLGRSHAQGINVDHERRVAHASE